MSRGSGTSAVIRTLAQFIVAEGFAPVVIDGFFAKSELDPEFVAAEEARVTEGYFRLLELPGSGLPLTEYPLPSVRSRWQAPAPVEDRSGSSWQIPASKSEASPVSGQTT